MNINGSTRCNKKTVSIDNHNVLYTKLDKLKVTMSKLTTQNNNKAIMTEVDSKTEICGIVGTDLKDHHTKANLSLDITSEEETEEILGKTSGFTRVEVDQETCSIQENLEEITAAVGQYQIQEWNRQD